MSRFSSTVMPGNTRRPSGDWQRPIRTRSCAGTAVMSTTVEHDASRGDGPIAGNGFERGRFASTVGPDEGDDLALVDVERDAFDGFDAAVVHMEVRDFEQTASSAPAGAPRYASMTMDSLRISSGMPSAMRLPKSSTLMISHTLITRLMSCSISNTVKPRAANASDQAAQRHLFRGVETGRRLVQEKQLGLGGHGPGDFEAALIAVRQVAGGVVGACVDAHERQQFHRLIERLLLLATGTPQPGERGGHACAVARVGGDHHILESSHFAKEADVLEGAGYTSVGDLVLLAAARSEFPAKLIDPAGRLVHPGYHIKHGGLAGAVRTDEAGDLTASATLNDTSSSATTPPNCMVTLSSAQHVGHDDTGRVSATVPACRSPVTRHTCGCRESCAAAAGPVGRKIIITTSVIPNKKARRSSRNRNRSGR